MRPPTGTQLHDYLVPKYFNHVAKAALMCALHDEDDDVVDLDKMKAPSNAVKLAYDLKKLASIKLGNIVISGKSKKHRRESKDFLQLLTLRWSTKLAREALKLKRHSRNKALPLPEDIEKFAQYLKSTLNGFDTTLVTLKNYRLGVILAQARLISFNRRRCGEMQAFRYSTVSPILILSPRRKK